MDEITGALIAIALVLSAVFLPMAFFGGSTGVIYRQFSITIVSAMVLSVLVALILTPGAVRDDAQAARARTSARRQRACSRASSRWFNDKFDRGQRTYETGVRCDRRAAGSGRCSVYAADRRRLVLLFVRLPTGFLPTRTRATCIALVQAARRARPPRAPQAALDQVRDYFLKNERRQRRTASSPSAASASPAQGQNSRHRASSRSKDWDERKGDDNTRAGDRRARDAARSAQLRDAHGLRARPAARCAASANRPASTWSCSTPAGIGHDELLAARDQLLGMAAQDEPRWPASA